jgi:hypothetical protein
MAFSILVIINRSGINDTLHNVTLIITFLETLIALMLNVIVMNVILLIATVLSKCSSVECGYADFHCANCNYAESL